MKGRYDICFASAQCVISKARQEWLKVLHVPRAVAVWRLQGMSYGSWAEAVAAGRRKHGDPALSPLRSGSASALLSPPSENPWRPAALTAVRGSPLGGSARYNAAPPTTAVDMEQLWAEAISDEASGATARRTRKNRIVRGRARNLSFSDFSSLRGALGEEKSAAAGRGGADSAFECRVIGWSPRPPPWDGEAPPVSAEPPQQQESGGATAAGARPASTMNRPAAAAAIRNLKLRIFSNRRRDDCGAASSPSAVVVSPAAATPASAIPKSPSLWRGPTGVS
ncbi:unnamed protein product [Closterium sp. Yama58-4]|nr:unnamed protein product [Closterium sp. Yama58-4]